MPRGHKVEGNGYQGVSQEEKQLRIEKSAIWKLENPDNTYTDFINWCNAKWGYKRKQSTFYWNEAKKHLNETIREDSESARKIAEASLGRMLRKALDADDNKLALEIRKEINKIAGVYVHKIEINDNTEKPFFNVEPIKASEKDEG